MIKREKVSSEELQEILQVVSNVTKIPVKEIKDKTRNKETFFAKHLFIFFAKEYGKDRVSFKKIGEVVGMEKCHDFKTLIKKIDEDLKKEDLNITKHYYKRVKREFYLN